jgi:rRNA maturation protein Nop10
MALIKCPDCGHDVSDTAPTCAHCGRPIAVASPVEAEVTETPDQFRVRETVRHEEALINSRLTWMLTFEGFLFTAVSLASGETRQPFLDTVPVAGALVALLALAGVAAAYGHIDAVRKEAPVGKFGSVRWPKWVGRGYSAGLCIVVAGAWLALYFALRPPSPG